MGDMPGNLPRRSWGGMAALAGVLTFIATVATLHLLQPGYDPVHQLMSELAMGDHGWAMLAAFAGLAVAVLGIQAAVGAAGASWGYRILLSAGSLSFLVAGVFPLGTAADMHIASIAMAFMLMVLAMYFFPSSAGAASSVLPRSLAWFLAAAVVMSVALSPSILPMGIGQRLAAAFLLAWLAILGWRLKR